MATSSAASASALGRRDHELNRDEALAHAHLIVGATDLPVSADLGKGFGDAPEAVAETIRFASEMGLVGGTIEDATGNEDRPLYDFGLAVERIAAGVEAAHALPFPFILTARAHNFLYSAPSLDETISRLQAFEKAGADVLFAPGLPDLAAVGAVCAALSADGSFVGANAAKESRIPREQLGEAAQVHHTVRQYLRDVQEQNPVEEPVHEQDQVSTTDPDSTYATKGRHARSSRILRQLSGG